MWLFYSPAPRPASELFTYPCVHYPWVHSIWVVQCSFHGCSIRGALTSERHSMHRSSLQRTGDQRDGLLNSRKRLRRAHARAASPHRRTMGYDCAVCGRAMPAPLHARSTAGAHTCVRPHASTDPTAAAALPTDHVPQLDDAGAQRPYRERKRTDHMPQRGRASKQTTMMHCKEGRVARGGGAPWGRRCARRS